MIRCPAGKVVKIAYFVKTSNLKNFEKKMNIFDGAPRWILKILGPPFYTGCSMEEKQWKVNYLTDKVALVDSLRRVLKYRIKFIL